jgi:plastocyanin
MRKLLLPLVAVAALAVAGVAAGKTTKTVTISHTGYTPTAVSITTGDAVLFKNTDTVAHTVQFSSTTGVTCSAAVPLVIQAGQSASCTFSTAGKYRFSDPANNKKAFRGTITVTPPLVSSLKAVPKTVVYGNKSTISGKLSSGQSGQAVQIHAQACGETKSTVVGTATTTAGGAFTFQVQPTKKTTYTLSNKGLTATIGVNVQPKMVLVKLRRHHYKLTVTAAQNFVGKVATFQRYRPALRHWVKVKRVVLKTNLSGTPPTENASVTFRSRVKARRLRASLGPHQVVPCYATAHSNTIHS